jgi:hypothetical protein
MRLWEVTLDYRLESATYTPLTRGVVLVLAGRATDALDKGRDAIRGRRTGFITIRMEAREVRSGVYVSRWGRLPTIREAHEHREGNEVRT